MKRSLMLILMFALVLTLASCGGENGGDTEPFMDGSEKVLVVWFSASGNTDAVAGTIAETLEADTFEIVPVEPYTRLSKKPCGLFRQRGTCGQISLNFAKFREICPAAALQRTASGTFARQKGFFARRMSSQKILNLSFCQTDCLPEMSHLMGNRSLVAVSEGGLVREQVLEGAEGPIHYSYILPASYDPTQKYPLMMTMPGYGQMWFGEDSSGSNISWNGFQNWANLDEPMIVVSAQLTDWNDKSARQANELAEYFLDNFPVDTNRVYAAGYSAGGETMSRAVSMRPDLYAAYLHVASQWDGTYAPLAEKRVAVYIFMGESDEYYGSQRARDAYAGLTDAYRAAGLTEDEINELIVLNIPDAAWFRERGVTNQHGGGSLIFEDTDVLNWIVSFKK